MLSNGKVIMPDQVSREKEINLQLDRSPQNGIDKYCV